MKFKIVEEKENPMLKRKELMVSLDYEGGSTTSKADLQKLLSEQMNANIENVEISKILSEIGRTGGKAWVKVWQEKKVPIYSEKKKESPKEEKKEQPKEEPKKEEVKKEKKPKEEAKPAEQPKEEKKDEPKKEEPAEKGE